MKKGFATVAKISTAAMGAAATGVMAFAKSSVDAASTFETSFAQLQTIMDTTAMNAENMSAGLLKLSSQLGVSASELAETTYNAISATGDTAGSLDIVENATKLATAGFTDTASALSTLTTIMNAYGMTAEETTDISDSLIAVQNLGVTTVSELSASMGKAIASASAYSVDLYNLESAYVSLTKGGINTAESTTYISSMLKELGSESSKVSKTIKSKTGKSFAQLMNDGKSLGDVLKILNESVDGDANALMNLWSSAEAGKASNAIVSQGLDEFNKNLLSIAGSSGATQTAYDKMADTLEFKTNRLKTNFENLKIAFGNNLIPGIGDIVSTVTDGLGEITEAVQNGDWDAAFSALGDTLSNVVSNVSEKLPALAELSGSLLKALFDGMTANAGVLLDGITGLINAVVALLPSLVPDLITGATSLLVTLINALSANAPLLVDSVVSVVETLISSITENNVIQNLTGVLIDLVKLGLEGLTQILPSVLPEITGVIIELLNLLTDPSVIAEITDAAFMFMMALTDGLINSADLIVDAAPKLLMNLALALVNLATLYLRTKFNIGKKIVETIFDKAADVWETVKTWFDENIWQPISEWWDETWGKIQEFFQPIVDTLSPIFESLGELFSAFGELATAVWELIKQKVGDAVESVKTKFGEIWNKISTVASDVWDKISETFGKIIEPIKQPLQDFYDLIAGKFDEAKEKVTGIVSEAWNWGHDLIQNIINGISSLIDSLTSKVKGVASTIFSFLHQSTADVGPLKDTDKWGGDLMENIINGIDSKRGELERMVANVADSMDFRSAMTVTPEINAGASSTDAKIDRLIDLVQTYLPQAGNIRLELDGEVVAQNMDERLGAMTAVKARV